MASQINAIDTQSVHKICSGQVVLDLATAVKELVENSIDAGASSVEVKFKDNGIEGFEVIDNGSGIDPTNYESLALKHYTSKLNTFEDLENVLTFGFRGEALSSLSALCNLTVVTATKEQAPMGFKLEFDMNGVLTSKTPIARSVGTTLQLSNIFYSLPVRQQEFKRNIKREFAKALGIIQAYSIISTAIRISVSNQSGTKPSVRVMSTSGNKDLIANVSNVFGAKLASQIVPFKVDLESIIGEGTVEGFISKPEWGIGRSSADRQYFYVNGRPCSLPRLSKALNETYRTFISNQYPVIIANLKMPTNGYDVNVSPDKRTIFVHEESKIADAIMEQLKQQLEPSRSTFQVNALMASNARKEPVSAIDDTNAHITEISHLTVNTPNESLVESIDPIKVSNSEVNNTSRNTRLTSSDISGNYSLSKVSNTSSIINSFKPVSSNIRANGSTSKRPAPITSSLLKFLTKRPKTYGTDVDDDPVDVDDDPVDGDDLLKDKAMEDDGLETLPDDINEEKNVELESRDCEMIDDEQEYTKVYTGIKSINGLWNTVGRRLTVATKLDDITPAIKNQAECPVTVSIEASTLRNASIKNTVDNEKAINALNRVISKPDFATMKILGQFNLGFIITSLHDQDIYIIDQHASDEKYNFETLQQTTRMETQKLFSPQELELTAGEEHVVMDNLDIFKANGFGVQVFPDNEPTKRIRVISHPVSKNTIFDKKDFSELIFLINEHPGEMVRCSRVRDIFAMRACHKAVRIGQSLNTRKMAQIVNHMGDIDQPWNCPHGRPTMRHLLNLSQFKHLQPPQPNRTLSFNGSFSISK